MSFIQVFSDDEPDTNSLNSPDRSLLTRNHHDDELWDLIPSNTNNHTSSINHLNSSRSPNMNKTNSISNLNQNNFNHDYSITSTYEGSLESEARKMDQFSLSNLNTTTSNTSTSYIDYFDVPESGPMSDTSILDNIDELSRKKVSGVKIDIFVTKNVPKAHVENKLQHKLKEYTSGELVHGYILIENTSSKQIPFEMFSISLEGVSINNQDNSNVSKKFLRMFDLTASFHYGYIPTTSAIKYSVDDIDAFDHSTLGFKDDKFLEPKTRYKKFFSFKFPHVLLDNNCIHSQSSHCMLPPSFGTNRKVFKGSPIQAIVDPVLRYGHEDIRGSPLVLDDGCFDTCSIAYTIEAKLLKKEESGEVFIIGDSGYNLRFIPFGHCRYCQPPISDMNSVKEVEKLLKVVENNMKGIADDMDSSSEKFNHSNLEYLDKILDYHQDNCSSNCCCAAPPDILISTEKFFHNKKVIKLPKLFGNGSSSSSKAKQSLSMENMKGVLKVSCKVPTQGISYMSPAIIRKFNGLGTMNKVGVKNVVTLQESVLLEDKLDLTTLEINLEYFIKKTEGTTSLPKIESIQADLVSVTARSRYSIPIKLTPDFVLENNNGEVEINQYKAKFKAYADKIKSQNIRFPKHLYNDIKSIADLNFNVQTIPLFKVSNYKISNWEQSTMYNNDNGRYYNKSIKVDLSLKKFKDTLVPSFQSCLLAKIYCVQLRVNISTFSSGSQHIILNVPITVRQYEF